MFSSATPAKVLEEHRLQAITPKMREAMVAWPWQEPSAVDYVNAGTVEFLVDPG